MPYTFSHHRSIHSFGVARERGGQIVPHWGAGANTIKSDKNDLEPRSNYLNHPQTPCPHWFAALRGPTMKSVGGRLVVTCTGNTVEGVADHQNKWFHL